MCQYKLKFCQNNTMQLRFINSTSKVISDLRMNFIPQVSVLLLSFKFANILLSKVLVESPMALALELFE